MIRHAAPVLQQLLISPDAPRDVRLVRPEECLHGIRRQLARLAIVSVAERMHIVPPKLGGESPHRLGVSQRLAVYLNLIPQHIHRVRRRRQHADALFGGEPKAVLRCACQIHARMRLLECLRQHAARRHIPELALPLKLVRLPDLRQHRQRLAPHIPRIARIHAQPQLLIGVGSPRPELHAPVRQLIHHRHPLRYPDRMRVRQNGHAEPYPDALGNLAQRPEQHLRAGRP